MPQRLGSPPAPHQQGTAYEFDGRQHSSSNPPSYQEATSFRPDQRQPFHPRTVVFDRAELIRYEERRREREARIQRETQAIRERMQPYSAALIAARERDMQSEVRPASQRSPTSLFVDSVNSLRSWFATPQSATPQSATPQSATPQSATPQSAMLQSATPVSEPRPTALLHLNNWRQPLLLSDCEATRDFGRQLAALHHAAEAGSLSRTEFRDQVDRLGGNLDEAAENEVIAEGDYWRAMDDLKVQHENFGVSPERVSILAAPPNFANRGVVANPPDSRAMTMLASLHRQPAVNRLMAGQLLSRRPNRR